MLFLNVFCLGLQEYCGRDTYLREDGACQLYFFLFHLSNELFCGGIVLNAKLFRGFLRDEGFLMIMFFSLYDQNTKAFSHSDLYAKNLHVLNSYF